MAARQETIATMAGRVALSIGRTDMATPRGWQWSRLLDLAQLESGHTPSRKHPDYWDGGVPWVGIRDARIHHGGRIVDTLQKISELGLANSAARWLPKNTVCLSRTASVGYVTILDRPMATSQDFVNWICGDKLVPEFLMWLLVTEHESLWKFGKGSTHTTIYFPEVQAFHVCAPAPSIQKRIVKKIEALTQKRRRAKDALDAVPPLLERFRQSVLASAFRGDLTKDWRAQHPDVEPIATLLARTDVEASRTGRSATINTIAGRAALAVGMPDTEAPQGWQWTPLGVVARLESGHTPSRRHPEWWGGEVPWIGIKDASEHHSGFISDTRESTNAKGLANSAARILPAGTVCLSRTASVGYVVVMVRPMATSQDFANWVCSPAIDPEFLMYALLAEGDHLRKFGKGTTHTTIYFPELKAFHVCLPSLEEQREIVRVVRDRLALIERLVKTVDQARERAQSLDASILAKAFRGELTGGLSND